jgi:hypothetical protein
MLQRGIHLLFIDKRLEDLNRYAFLIATQERRLSGYNFIALPRANILTEKIVCQASTARVTLSERQVRK